MSFKNKMAPSISNDVLFPALHRMLDSGDFISIFGN